MYVLCTSTWWKWASHGALQPENLNRCTAGTLCHSADETPSYSLLFSGKLGSNVLLDALHNHSRGGRPIPTVSPIVSSQRSETRVLWAIDLSFASWNHPFPTQPPRSSELPNGFNRGSRPSLNQYRSSLPSWSGDSPPANSLVLVCPLCLCGPSAPVVCTCGAWVQCISTTPGPAGACFLIVKPQIWIGTKYLFAWYCI